MESGIPPKNTNHADVLAPAELARINKRLWELDSLAVDRGSLTAAEQAEYDELDARLERHLAAVAPWPKKELDARWERTAKAFGMTLEEFDSWDGHEPKP